MRWSQPGRPAVCDSRWRTRTVSSLPASANSGQYVATGASTSTRPRLASTSSDRHDIVFVVENTLMIVSSSHGTVPAVVLGAAPQVDDELAVDRDGDRRADVTLDARSSRRRRP